MALCYRDRSFCGATDCATTDCDRNITPEVFEAACRWSGDREPDFSIMHFEASCPDYNPTGNE